MRRREGAQRQVGEAIPIRFLQARPQTLRYPDTGYVSRPPMQLEYGPGRWLRVLRDPDERSRRHLRLFGGQIGFIVLFSSPTLAIDHHRPILFLSLIHLMFGFSALLVFGAALWKRDPIPPASLCVWDHGFAMLLLMLISSVVLRALA